MYKAIEKYKKELTKLSVDFDIPFMVIGVITLNESGCDPMVKPFYEKNWRYFADVDGKALNLIGSNKAIQEQALRILGDSEFNFQIHAHGAFQVVGSVMRELGYKPKEMTVDFYTQGVFAMKHLSKMRDRFVIKYKHEPSHEQMWSMWNGGFGSVTSERYDDYTEEYVKKSLNNRKGVI